MKTFETFKNWKKLYEQKKNEETFGCIMLEGTVENWDTLHLDGIEKSDIYDDSQHEYGLEEKPHMTLLYGIHEDEIDPSVIRETMKQNIESFSVEISKIGYFEGEDFDVVKYDIPVTKTISNYRKLFLKTFENTQTFKDYHPHMTIAYVKKGKGKKYEKKLEEPFEVTFTRGVYSYHIEEKGEKVQKRSVIRLRQEDDPEEPDLSHP